MIFTYEDMKAAERMAREMPEHLHYRRYARMIDVIKDGKAEEIHLYIQPMTENERKIVKAGCLINFNRNK